MMALWSYEPLQNEERLQGPGLQDYRQHQNRTGIKAFKCICGKDYVTYNALWVHY